MIEIHTDNKLHMPGRQQLLLLIPFALFYCGAAILGQLEKARTLGTLRNLGRILLWFAGSYGVLLFLCMILSQRKGTVTPRRRRREGKWYVYVLFTAGCLLCYLPYFLMYFPGWLNNDAVWQIEQILGWAPGSNHHPYFHTLIMKCFFMAGYRLSGTYTGGAAFYTFSQVLIMAMVFGFFLYWLYKRGTRILWLILAFAFYAVLPVNGLLTICMGKDEFFTAALLFFAWMTVEFDLDALTEAGRGKRAEYAHESRGWKKLNGRTALRGAAYFVTGLLVCLLRSNGIFIFLGTVFILIVSKKVKSGIFPARTCVCAAAVLLCYMIWHGPVLRALDVEPPDTIEGLTMPVQHILCAYLKGGELTEEEIGMIDQVAPADQVGDYYNPWLFDIVKNFIREEGNQQVIEDNKWAYFKLWLEVGLRNPFQYMVAEVRQTAGYWAYDVKDYERVYGEYYMVDNPFGITAQRKLFTYENELAMHDFLMGFQDLYNKVWSLGLNTWLMVFGIAYLVYHRRNVMIYVPFLMLLITLLLATPVYNEFRYAYGLFAAFPILFAYSFPEG
ncbi:MAG: hypothetical protein K2O13_10660 [Lachnospiraceae bacterium]|nr:hypothetical protein [Lachnospiraceae bacterium]